MLQRPYLCTHMKYQALFISLGLSIGLNAQSVYTDNIASILQDAESRHSGRIGFSLLRLSDRQSLYDYRQHEVFTPASVVKILSTGASLRTLGRRYRYATEVYSVGTIRRDTLHGSLLVRGYGDPSIASDEREGERDRFCRELHQALKERGIKHITGSMYLDASLPTRIGAVSSWDKEDLDEAYGAGLYGLNYAENKIGNRANPRPAESLAKQIYDSLISQGIELSKAPIVSYNGYEPEGVLLYTYYSPTLESLARSTNHRSSNLYAEAIGRILEPKRERGEALSHHWRSKLHIDSLELSLADASGLSRSNRLSPYALGQVLLYLFGGQVCEDGTILETLPRLGYEGTVRTLMPYNSLRAYLKSGTMRRVSTYAGYIYHGGEWYAIVYLSNGFTSARIARGVLTALIEDIFR